MQMAPPGFARPRRTRGRRRLGILYEEKVHRELLERYPGYLPSPWFRFYDSEGFAKWCQCDGIIVNPWLGLISIVEVKYQHCNEAVGQLFGLYRPVVEALFAPFYRVACVEVVKWFDPAILTDRTPKLCRDPQFASPEDFNVHIWRPRPNA